MTMNFSSDPLEKAISVLKELGIYLLAGLLFFLISTFSAFFYPVPDTKTPNLVEPPPKRTVPVSTFQPPEPIDLGFLKIILYFLSFLGLLAVLILLLTAARKIQNQRVPRDKAHSFKEKVQKLKFSRDEAIRILQESLKTGNYSQGIIDAFHVLDEQLNNFRKIARPKHWTPKEYSVGVTDPVFKPNAYVIVRIFYRTQYGRTNASKEDVLQSLDALQHLFIDENLPERREKMTRWFEDEFSTMRQWEIIPRTGNLLKPKPRKKKGGKQF